MRLEDISHIGVLGGGVMGGGIAQIMSALAGYRVIVRDLTQEILDDTRDEVVERKWGVKRAVERGKLGFDQATRAIENVSYTLNVEDLADCDLIIEAVPEQLAAETSRLQRTRWRRKGRLHLCIEYFRFRH